MGKMSEVTAESLAWRIGRLEEQQRVVGLSLKDVYNLAAYKMLLERIEKESFVDDFMAKVRGPL